VGGYYVAANQGACTLWKKILVVKTLVNGPYCRVGHKKKGEMDLVADLSKKILVNGQSWQKKTLAS